jgi:hypothetical protein
MADIVALERSPLKFYIFHSGRHAYEEAVSLMKHNDWSGAVQTGDKFLQHFLNLCPLRRT